MKQFQLQWIIDEEMLVKKFLQNQNISKKALTDIKFAGGDILVNGSHVTVLHKLKKGEILTVLFPIEQASEQLIAEQIPLEAVYEDDYVLVVNKPSQMNTIPSREHPTGSLANALMGYFEKTDVHSTVHIVTRLDRDTSGLVLIAKHRHIHHLFSLMQRKNEVKRVYEAFALGAFTELSGTINAPIARKSDSIIERCVAENGQHAVTHYKVLEQYEHFTHVQLNLETGRTHQIRVHLSYLEHPLLGDTLYGGNKGLINRQALHCCSISFIHPVTQQNLYLTIPLPKDMLNLV